MLGAADALLLFMAASIGLAVSLGAAALDPFDSLSMAQRMGVVVIMVCMLFVMGLYHRANLLDFRMTVVRLGVSVVFGVLVSLVLFQAAPDVVLWTGPLVVTLSIGFFGLLANRYLIQRVAGSRALARRVLVIGTGGRARRILDVQRERHLRDFTCVGFMDVEGGDPLVPGRILTRDMDILAYCRSQAIDEAVVALEERRGNVPVDTLVAARTAGVTVSDLSSFLERETGKVELDGLYPSWLIFSGPSRQTRLSQALKRAADVVLSLILLAIGAIPMLLAALAIKLEDGGPLFYTQERVGLNGVTFRVIKFRSMRVDAERDGKARWAQKNDDRITRVGHIIRKIRVDELPQIFNVLKGEMSFIGPRPERPSIVSDLQDQIPFYQYRHFMKPGITGWAQINYPYGASVEDAREKLKYDLYYIKNYSLLLDLLVVLQTVRVILFSEGAR